jgi:hypothetical protein
VALLERGRDLAHVDSSRHPPERSVLAGLVDRLDVLDELHDLPAAGDAVLVVGEHASVGLADRRVSPVELLEQLHPARGQGLDPRLARVGAGVLLRLHRSDQGWPLALRRGDVVLAEPLAALVERRELLVGEVLLELLVHLRHLVDQSQQVRRGRGPGTAHPSDQRAEGRLEGPQRAELGPDLGDVRFEDLTQAGPSPIQHVTDGLEREPQLAQRDHLIDPLHVGDSVETVSRSRPGRWSDQPQLVPVVQRAHRETGGLGQLTDLPPLRLTVAHLPDSLIVGSPRGGDEKNARNSRRVRFKTEHETFSRGNRGAPPRSS